MAARRMFAISFVESDKFTEMPLSSQALYFHVCLQADDDGIVNNALRIKRMINASDDDLKLLIAKGFLLVLEQGLYAVTHWHQHNYLRSDRYKETIYKEQKRLLILNANGEYTLIPDYMTQDLAEFGIPPDNQVATQGSVDEVSIEQDRIEEDSVGESDNDNVMYTLGKQNLTHTQYNNLISKFPINTVDETIQRIMNKPYIGCLTEEKISEWCNEKQSIPKKSVQSKNKGMQRQYDFDELQRTLIQASQISMYG